MEIRDTTPAVRLNRKGKMSVRPWAALRFDDDDAIDVMRKVRRCRLTVSQSTRDGSAYGFRASGAKAEAWCLLIHADAILSLRAYNYHMIHCFPVQLAALQPGEGALARARGGGVRGPLPPPRVGRGLHSSKFRLNVSIFWGTRWVVAVVR